MELIRSWLNGSRNYNQGVQLYLQYGKDDILRSLFKKEGETTFKKDRLFEALKDLHANFKKSFTQLSEARVEQESIIPNKSENVSNKPGWDDTDDIVLITLKNDWKKCFSEMKMLQHRLTDIATKEERCAAAHRILDLDDQCDEFYAKRDYYLEHKKLPEERSDDIVGDPVKWPVKLANARRYVREYKIRLKKDPRSVAFAAKLKKYEEEVIFYEEKLKLHAD